MEWYVVVADVLVGRVRNPVEAAVVMRPSNHRLRLRLRLLRLKTPRRYLGQDRVGCEGVLVDC